MKKGFWRTLESVLAVVILVFFLMALGSKYTFPMPDVDLPRKGYEILRDLDNRGELRSDVVNNQSDVLNSKISINGYNHSVQICDLSGCSGDEPNAVNVWISTYLISGDNTYDPHEVKLFIW